MTENQKLDPVNLTERIAELRLLAASLEGDGREWTAGRVRVIADTFEALALRTQPAAPSPPVQGEACGHEWIDVTYLGNSLRWLRCSKCELLRYEPLPTPQPEGAEE